MRKISWLFTVIVITLLLAGCSQGKKSMELMHIHGLGYSNDGTKILIPAHNGIAVYENGLWGPGDGEKRDYMGFNTVDTGFYSSGHPAAGSNEKNPLGIVKSEDGGKTINHLNIYGIEDFHAMAVGYKNHTIYIYNPSPNPSMSTTGLYRTLDDAKTWIKSKMAGIQGEVVAIAAHPTDSGIVALVTNSGLYVSKDSGDQFELVPVSFPVTAAAFNISGELMIGGQEAIMINGSSTVVSPPMDQDDAVQYLAQNPSNPEAFVLSTYKKDVFISTDNGGTWTQIAKQGEALFEK